jgi:hypothetical protein
LGEKFLALPEALDGSQLQPLLPFIGHVFERHVLNLTERCRNPTRILSLCLRLARRRLENSNGLNRYLFAAGRNDRVAHQLALKRANSPVSENSHLNKLENMS